MTHKQYDELDRRIVKAIARGKQTFSAIYYDDAVMAESCRLEVTTGADAWRIADRRLQALRKAGRIVYAGRTWSVVQQAQEAAR